MISLLADRVSAFGVSSSDFSVVSLSAGSVSTEASVDASLTVSADFSGADLVVGLSAVSEESAGGIISVSPTSILLLTSGLSCCSCSTLTSYWVAISHSESPSCTVWVRDEEDSSAEAVSSSAGLSSSEGASSAGASSAGEEDDSCESEGSDACEIISV